MSQEELISKSVEKNNEWVQNISILIKIQNSTLNNIYVHKYYRIVINTDHSKTIRKHV